MRKVLGSGVLVLGTVALGLWARADHAARMEAAVEQATAIALAASVHGVGASVSGRDITLTGLADTAAERAALLAAAQAVPGRRIVNADGLAVLPAAVPYVTEITKAEGGALSASGHLPREALRAALAPTLAGAEAGLTLASGAPDGWADMVQAGVAALGFAGLKAIEAAEGQAVADARLNKVFESMGYAKNAEAARKYAAELEN
jgi:OOP family OmpA-OmpF porin